MTILNDSFEVPDGTIPAVTSGGSEPFALVDGTFLDFDIQARGGFSQVARWTVDAADFFSVGAAMADEVRDAINSAGIMGIEADSAGGRVTVKAVFNGSTLRVLGGQPQTVLLFPTDPVTGEVHFGAGQVWDVAATAGHLEVGGFGADPELPFESFEVDWGEVEVELAGDAFLDAFEDGWVTLTPGGSLEVGSFAEGNLFDSFEGSWDVLVVGGFIDAAFNPGAKPAEDFEEDWDITGASEPPSFDVGMFNDGADAFDGFENAVVWTHVIEVVSVVAGTYVVEINGTPYEYQATLLDTLATIGQGLVDDINAGTQMGAGGVNPFTLTPTPLTTTIPNVVVHGPAAGSISVVLATDSPIFTDQWVGQDNFPETT